jgi:hypothetical protein
LTLGVDTLCWHLRVEKRDLPVEDVLVESKQAGVRREPNPARVLAVYRADLAGQSSAIEAERDWPMACKIP